MGTLYRNGVPYIGSGGAGGVEVTQAEYDELPQAEKLNGSIYFITDGSVSYPTASQMRYDNTESQIPATSVQGAIDENKISIDELKNGLSNKDWKYLVRNVNANGTYTMDYDFSEIDSLMFLFIYGSLPRQSVVLPKAHVEYYENQCMPDVMFANSRCYLKATFSGKQMTVTDFTNGIANAWWYVFCKLK